MLALVPALVVLMVREHGCFGAGVTEEVAELERRERGWRREREESEGGGAERQLRDRRRLRFLAIRGVKDGTFERTGVPAPVRKADEGKTVRSLS